MRLLFFGDLAATGFGTVTMDLGRALLEQGHDLRFVSQNTIATLHAETCGYEKGFPCNCTPKIDLPEPFAERAWIANDPAIFKPELRDREGDMDGLGATSLALRSYGYAGYFNGRLWRDGWIPEACILLGDFGNVELMAWRDEETRAAFAMVPTFHYVPIEGVDLPPLLREMWHLIHPIAMTEFGADEIEKVTGSRPPMIYHGVDAATFHPVSPESMLVVAGKKLRSKDDCKRAIGLEPDRRMILRTDRNVERKRYPELLRSMAPVLAARPDTVLVLHCNDFDQGGKIAHSLSKYPERIRSQIIVTDRGGMLDRGLLVALYNAADVYVSNAAEGFGLTIAEALACGVPAVGLDYSAVPEVIGVEPLAFMAPREPIREGAGGLVTTIAGLVDNEYGYYWASANQRLFAQAVAQLLDNEPDRKRLGRGATDHIRRSFSWTIAARQFTDILGGEDPNRAHSLNGSGRRSTELVSAGSGRAPSLGVADTVRSPSPVAVR